MGDSLQTDGSFNARKWGAFAVVALTTFMGALDFSFINLSYPMLTRFFNSQLATVVWLNLVFSLVLVSFGPLFGKLGDILWRKKLFVAGSVLMIGGLAACSLSKSIEHLIVFRTLHAFGNAMTVTCFAAIVTDAFPKNEWGKGLGLQNASQSLGFVAGPFLAGVLLSWLDWQAIFYMRIPVVAAILLMALILLKKEKHRAPSVKFDLAGTTVSSAGFLSLIIGISLVSKLGANAPIAYVLIMLGLLLTAFFVYVETKATNPIVDLSLFKKAAFSTGMVTMFLFWCALQGSTVTLPFYLMGTLGLSTSQVGFLFTITPIIMFVISPISGSVSDRIGSNALIIIGIVLSLVCYLIMWTFNQQTGMALIIILQIIAGISTGIFQPTNMSLIMRTVQTERRGIASALAVSVLSLGMALGIAWTGAFYSMRMSHYKEALLTRGVNIASAGNQSVHSAFHDAIVLATFIQVLALIFAVILFKTRTGSKGFENEHLVPGSTAPATGFPIRKRLGKC